MAFGPVNTPGPSVTEIKGELDKFAAEILSGDISAPMETSAGEPITTTEGAEIRVHGKIATPDDRSYANEAASAVTASVVNMIEREYISAR